MKNSESVAFHFEYSEHTTFDDITSAMASFSSAINSYAKNKEISLEIDTFQSGSLVCNLNANEIGMSVITRLLNDVDELLNTGQSIFMPDQARRHIKNALRKVQAITIKARMRTQEITSQNAKHIEVFDKSSNILDVEHTGLVDKIDLKANNFRIILPHGRRITCRPAYPFITHLTAIFQQSEPRATITGQGKFKGLDILPGEILVVAVEPRPKRKPLMELVAEINSKVDRTELNALIKQHNAYLANISDSEETSQYL